MRPQGTGRCEGVDPALEVLENDASAGVPAPLSPELALVRVLKPRHCCGAAMCLDHAFGDFLQTEKTSLP